MNSYVETVWPRVRVVVRAQPSEMSSSSPSSMPPKKRERGGSIDTNIFGGAFGRKEGRESERFPASLNMDHRIVPRFFSPSQTLNRREGAQE